MRIKTLLFILATLTSNFLCGQVSFGFDSLLVSNEVHRIIEVFDTARQVESSNLYFSGQPSQIFPYFAELKQKAPTSELIELCKHPSPITRYYSFSALLKRETKKKILLEIVKIHLKDTIAVTTQSGCIRGESSIGSFMLSALEYSKKYSLELQETNEIDSLLFWNEEALIEERNRVFKKLSRNQQNYHRLKEIITKENNPHVLLPLLSYGQKEDQEFIQGVFPVSPKHALLAAQHYPRLELVPLIKSLQYKNRHDYSFETWEALYAAAFQYEQKITLDILLHLYEDDASLAARYQQAKFIYRAIKDRQEAYLNPVKLEIAWYLGEMSKEYFDLLWELDPEGTHKMFVKKITKETNRWLGDSLYFLIIEKLEEIHKDSTVYIIDSALKESDGLDHARLVKSLWQYHKLSPGEIPTPQKPLSQPQNNSLSHEGQQRLFSRYYQWIAGHKWLLISTFASLAFFYLLIRYRKEIRRKKI